MNDTQPMHDAPMRTCGEGVLVPVAYDNGMTRPVGPESYMAQIRHMRCISTGETFYVDGLRAVQAWWSVGAHEQHAYDDRVADLKAEIVHYAEQLRLAPFRGDDDDGKP